MNAIYIYIIYIYIDYTIRPDIRLSLGLMCEDTSLSAKIARH
jgi:hypothetical protein